MLRIENQKYKCVVHIENEMTIYNATEIKNQLITLLNETRELEINLANVVELDSAGVQLLMLAKKERARNHQLLTLSEPSTATRDAIELMGLSDYFTQALTPSDTKGEHHAA